MKNKRTVLISSIFILILIVTGISLLCFRCSFVKTSKKGPKVAIVLDDWGYNLDCVDTLKHIDVPLTLSVLPHLKYSFVFSKMSEQPNRSVILHLPLEPERADIDLEAQTIITDMSDARVVEIFNSAMGSVPSACGVSNHMGSKGTKDRRIMALLFRELKKRNLFFLDSLVTGKSVCRELASQMHIKFACRDIFLDNLNEYEYIKEQFCRLIECAEKSGQAVGNGHAKSVTMEVLKNEIPLMQNKGINFVFVSDLTE